jgi:GntR family transcriptional regulator, transcriptional repressor for pyruvate dehydrogenase complex
LSNLEHFHPITSNRLSDEAVRQVKSLIDRGELQPGDKLPSERELVKRLSVSRASVREALRVLEALGLVEVQPGLGTFVSNHDMEELTGKWRTWLIEHKNEVVELLEVRQVIEPGIAALAVERITENELEELCQTLVVMEQGKMKSDIEMVVQADIAFHDLLGKATRNNTLISLSEGVNRALLESRYAYFQDLERVAISLKQHARIIEALRQKDAQAVKDALLHHVLQSRQIVQGAAND